MTSYYIDNPANPCRLNGCQFTKACSLLEQAQNAINSARKHEVREMDTALWCDKGGENGDGHPFSPRDKSRKLITVESYDGEPDQTMMLCKRHAQEAGFVPKDELPALENGESPDSPEIHDAIITEPSS